MDPSELTSSSYQPAPTTSWWGTKRQQKLDDLNSSRSSYSSSRDTSLHFREADYVCCPYLELSMPSLMLSIFDWHNLWLIKIPAQNQFGALWKQSLLHQEGTKEILATCKIWKQMFILNFRMNSLPLFDTCVTFCKEITFAHVWEYGNLIVNNEMFPI